MTPYQAGFESACRRRGVDPGFVLEKHAGIYDLVQQGLYYKAQSSLISDMAARQYAEAKARIDAEMANAKREKEEEKPVTVDVDTSLLKSLSPEQKKRLLNALETAKKDA